jgi:hypothetical protein
VVVPSVGDAGSPETPRNTHSHNPTPTFTLSNEAFKRLYLTWKMIIKESRVSEKLI